MPAPALDLVGHVYNRLKVLKRNPVNTKHNTARWDCVCDCGNFTTVAGNNLRTGQVKSCGCYLTEVLKTTSVTHGLTGTPEHNIWKTIKQRTTNERSQDYPDYGGRGISLCESWNEFENFIKDLGPRPSDRHSVDRRNNDGPYTPDNCYWATPEEQGNNRSTNVRYSFENRQLTAAQIAVEKGVSYEALRKRLGKGQTVEEALSVITQTRKE